MMMSKPEHRPGADVDDVDRTAYGPKDVDYVGEVGPYTYRAWIVEDKYRPGFVRAVIMRDGRLVQAQREYGPVKTSVYHTKRDIAHLRSFLFGKVRRERVPDESTWDVKQHPRHEYWQKVREEQREAERAAWDVETERVGDKTLCRIT